MFEHEVAFEKKNKGDFKRARIESGDMLTVKMSHDYGMIGCHQKHNV